MKILLVCLMFARVGFATELDGTWKGKCENASQGYTQEKLTFTGNSFQMLMFHFGSARCDDPNIRIESAGTFTTAHPEIDYAYGATLMTPLTSAMAMSMNLVGLCGVRNWKANKQVEVSGKTCEGESVPRVGQRQFSIYSRENSTLYRGAFTRVNDGLTPQSRPFDLDRTRPLTLE